MIALLLLATAAAPSVEDEVAFFSDDVTCQTEEEMCVMPSECEEQGLLNRLTPEGIRLYNSLDGRGKMRAVELLDKGTTPQLAVETAAEEMACRQNGEYPFKKDYQEELEERARLKPYTRRFGY